MLTSVIAAPIPGIATPAANLLVNVTKKETRIAVGMKMKIWSFITQFPMSRVRQDRHDIRKGKTTPMTSAKVIRAPHVGHLSIDVDA